MTKIVKAKIFFHKFDIKRIDQEGSWSKPYASFYLKLTMPLSQDGKGIDYLDQALDGNIKGLGNIGNVYKYIGEVDVDKKEPDLAFEKVQNFSKPHPLNDRSMMPGDIVLFPGDGAYFCEKEGWSKLSTEQVSKLIEKTACKID